MNDGFSLDEPKGSYVWDQSAPSLSNIFFGRGHVKRKVILWTVIAVTALLCVLLLIRNKS